MNSYELSRTWFNWCFDNPEKIKPIHTAMYFFIIEHCNRLGWKEKFGLPMEMTKDAIGVSNYRTYSKTLNDLIEWGFIKQIQKSKNQYSSTIIAIVKNAKAPTKALDKALQKHSQKQSRDTVCIDKQINNKQINNKQESFNLFWSKYPKKVNKKDSLNKFIKLPQKDIDKIMSTIDDFINYKPFSDYNHPNPTTYLNQKRWNDEIPTKNKKEDKSETHIKYQWQTDGTNMVRWIEKDKADAFFANNAQGGYIPKFL